jgi:hypothetical protein
LAAIVKKFRTRTLVENHAAKRRICFSMASVRFLRDLRVRILPDGAAGIPAQIDPDQRTHKH